MSVDTEEIATGVRRGSLDLPEIRQRLEGAAAGEILRWTYESFGRDRVAVTSSFQTQSLPLLHLVARHAPQLPIFFLDTGFHFAETKQFRDRVAAEFGLDVRSVRNELGHEEFRRRHGALYRSDPDLCCHLNKVEPLEGVLEQRRVWVTGIRRDQTETRSETPVVSETEKGEGTLKVCPMLDWSAGDVAQYRERYDLPEHPLTSKGYTSIGCAPCTESPSDSADDDRAGRWAGREKTECGLHVDGEEGEAGPPGSVEVADEEDEGRDGALREHDGRDESR